MALTDDEKMELENQMREAVGAFTEVLTAFLLEHRQFPHHIAAIFSSQDHVKGQTYHIGPCISHECLKHDLKIALETSAEADGEQPAAGPTHLH